MICGYILKYITPGILLLFAIQLHLLAFFLLPGFLLFFLLRFFLLFGAPFLPDPRCNLATLQYHNLR